MKNLVLFTVLLYVTTLAVAQSQHCGANIQATTNALRLPNQTAIRAAAQAEIELKTEELLRTQATKEGMLVRIPVVVHVVYKGSLENISDAQIFSQLDVLNEDFRRLNSTQTETPADFLPLAADMEIEFCLALRDPDGNPTSGITRTQTNFDNIGSLVSVDGRPRVFYAALGGADAWDAEKYLNIWVAKIGNGLLGMAAFPGSSPAEEDGILIDPRYFGTTGWAALNAPHHLGRTCTHEIGHFLDLQHIWGANEDSCDEDDGVGDTPVQRNPYLNCPTHPQMSCGNRSMFMNFMDYTDDACQNLFTQGQKARAWATLLTVRSELLSSDAACTVSTSSELASERLRIFPNPVSDRLFIEEGETELPLTGTVSLWRADGAMVFEKKLEAGILDASDLEQGMYFFKISNKKKVFVGRFIKI